MAAGATIRTAWEAALPANVYRIADPTSDSLHRLGTVTEAGEVRGYDVPAGRVDAAGQALRPDGTPAGHVSAAGAIFRAAGELAGHVRADGSVYRGAALIPQAVVGYVDPSATRAQMGGAALLLGLLD